MSDLAWYMDDIDRGLSAIRYEVLDTCSGDTSFSQDMSAAGRVKINGASQPRPPSVHMYQRRK